MTQKTTRPNKPANWPTYCQRTDCLNYSVKRVRSGKYTYSLCRPHAKEMEEFERSYKAFRAEMAAYYMTDGVMIKAMKDREKHKKDNRRRLWDDL